MFKVKQLKEKGFHFDVNDPRNKDILQKFKSVF